MTNSTNENLRLMHRLLETMLETVERGEVEFIKLLDRGYNLSSQSIDEVTRRDYDECRGYLIDSIKDASRHDELVEKAKLALAKISHP